MCLFIFVRARLCVLYGTTEEREGRISTAPLCDWILNGKRERGRERERGEGRGGEGGGWMSYH